MPYVANQNQDDEEKAGTKGGTPNNPGAAAGGYIQQSGGATNNITQPNTTFSSSALSSYQPNAYGGGIGSGPNGQWTNFQNFMNANQGAAQSTNQGLASDVSNQAQNAQGSIQNAQNQWGYDVNHNIGTQYQYGVGATPGTQGEDAYSAWKQVTGTTPSYATGTPTGFLGLGGTQGFDSLARQKATQDPNGKVSSWYGGYTGDLTNQQLDQQMTQLMAGTPGSKGTTTATAEYMQNAPQTMMQDKNIDWSGLTNQVGDAQSALNALGSQGGLQALIAQKYGGTGGDNAMDAALSGAYAGNTFSNVQNKYGNLAKALSDANANSPQTITNAVNNLQAQDNATFDPGTPYDPNTDPNNPYGQDQSEYM